MPGAAFDAEHGLWRSLRKTRKGSDYLFSLGFFGEIKKSKYARRCDRAASEFGKTPTAIQEQCLWH